jgi:hypothetical protein
MLDVALEYSNNLVKLYFTNRVYVSVYILLKTFDLDGLRV